MTVAEPLARARRRAILLVLAAAATFVVASALVKALAGAVPLAQVIFFRNVFALPLLLAMAMAAGGLGLLRPRQPAMHLQRAAFGLMGMVGAFHGFTHLPLATATALGFTMPLFLTALSVLLLGERVGWRRWTAVAVGFAGVLVIARPGGTEGGLPALSVGLVLLGALGWALAMMSIRRMGDAGESGVAIVVWFAVAASVASGLATIPVWTPPSATQWALLTGIGLVSAVAQLLMTEAYRRGETTLLAPFEYSGIVWTSLLGILIWAEWPDGWDLLGFAVLVGAGLFIWWRETRLGVRR
ncbi:DMT family transporter [Falsiroseomonas sp. CW058]|uniref:DMT family transporter n=1 Tax=Falsiroseomonas sp. CW058 TaxID=3388664 RepID=UPI003D3211F2